MKLSKLFKVTTVYAHCDLPCGVYDPAQARIEAESVLAIMQRYQQHLTDEVYKTRALIVKEERAELVKRHLWVLWTDYFKPEHVAAHPELHDLVWRATKAAGETKHSVDPADGEKLLALIDEVAAIYAATKAVK
jgi:nickel superoxide dismutase